MFAPSAIFMNKNLQEIWQKHITDKYLEPLFLYKFPLYKKENSNARTTFFLSISMAIGTLFFPLQTSNSAGSRIWHQLLNAGLYLDMLLKKIISQQVIS